LHQEAGGDAISFLKDAFPRKFPGIKPIPTTETEIKSIKKKLRGFGPLANYADRYNTFKTKSLQVMIE
jgi:hypothetical protein